MSLIPFSASWSNKVNDIKGLFSEIGLGLVIFVLKRLSNLGTNNGNERNGSLAFELDNKLDWEEYESRYADMFADVGQGADPV